MESLPKTFTEDLIFAKSCVSSEMKKPNPSLPMDNWYIEEARSMLSCRWGECRSHSPVGKTEIFLDHKPQYRRAAKDSSGVRSPACLKPRQLGRLRELIVIKV